MLYEREFHRKHTCWYLEYTYTGMWMYIQSHRALIPTETMTCKDWYDSVSRPQGKIYSNYGKPSCYVFLFLMEFEPVLLRQNSWKPDSCARSLSSLYYSCWSSCSWYRLLKYPPYQREAECYHNPGQGTVQFYIWRKKKSLLQFSILTIWSIRHPSCDKHLNIYIMHIVINKNIYHIQKIIKHKNYKYKWDSLIKRGGHNKLSGANIH